LTQVVNPALHSLPYTFILIAHINAHSNKRGNKTVRLEFLWEKIQGYLVSFDARQIRYVGLEFMQVLDAAATLAGAIAQVKLKLVASYTADDPL